MTRFRPGNYVGVFIRSYPFGSKFNPMFEGTKSVLMVDGKQIVVVQPFLSPPEPWRPAVRKVNCTIKTDFDGQQCEHWEFGHKKGVAP